MELIPDVRLNEPPKYNWANDDRLMATPRTNTTDVKYPTVCWIRCIAVCIAQIDSPSPATYVKVVKLLWSRWSLSWPCGAVAPLRLTPPQYGITGSPRALWYSLPKTCSSLEVIHILILNFASYGARSVWDSECVIVFTCKKIFTTTAVFLNFRHFFCILQGPADSSNPGYFGLDP